MPQNYYYCSGCGTTILLTYKAADVDSEDWPPLCDFPGCDGVLELRPQPGDFAMDVGGVKGAAFKAFTVDVDGTPTQVDSLHTLRRIERESEQRYRNGEGAPLRFRMWNQDKTNKDVGSFGTAGRIGDQVYDSGTPVPKSRKLGVTRHGQQKPRVPLGPGLSRVKSPLKG
jgi:hypothetical protein